jgi:uncharacterized protein YbcI
MGAHISRPTNPDGPGPIRAEIATAIVRLHSDFYGKGPTKAKAYLADDVITVVLEEVFTRAEQTLVARGEADAVSHARRRFRHAMSVELKGIVEHATGREVRALCAETDTAAAVSVACFLLDGSPAAVG